MSQAGQAASPVQSFVQKLEAFAESIKEKIVQFADKFIPQLEEDVEVALEDLAGIALDAVLTEAPKIISGREKFGNAVDSVVQTVEANGETVAVQTAQMAVQQAYLMAKGVAQANTKVQ